MSKLRFYLSHANNETDTHFGLKLAAWKWLADKCQIIGMEATDDYGGRIDVGGIKINWGRERFTYDREWERYTFQEYKEIITPDIESAVLRRVEAKASRSDFSRQFGNFGEDPSDLTPTGPEDSEELREDSVEREETEITGYRYIITPAGMFERDEIPSSYGWLEAYPENSLNAECRKNPTSKIIPAPYGRDQKVLSWVRRLAWGASSRMARRFKVIDDE